MDPISARKHEHCIGWLKEFGCCCLKLKVTTRVFATAHTFDAFSDSSPGTVQISLLYLKVCN
jgi:hypothetical protein